LIEVTHNHLVFCVAGIIWCVLQGLATRAKQRVWNTGDGRLKFMIIRQKEIAWHAGAGAGDTATYVN